MRSAAARTRALTNWTISLAALLAGGYLLAELLGGEDDDVVSEPAPAERGYYLNDATLTELGPDGKPRVVVKAKTIEQQRADSSVQLSTLQLDYTTQNQGLWHVTADRGEMPDRNSLLLAGNVRVTGHPGAQQDEAVILTDELSYDTRTKVVQTAAPVVVQFGKHELKGRGLRVGLNEGTLRLESNVHGRFTP
jgi:LPS export ABC transporter protein LptC